MHPFNPLQLLQTIKKFASRALRVDHQEEHVGLEALPSLVKQCCNSFRLMKKQQENSENGR